MLEGFRVAARGMVHAEVRRPPARRVWSIAFEGNVRRTARPPVRWLLDWFRRLRGTAPLGARGERAAAEFLERQGYRILERGRRYVFGEIDLVALEGETVVFVEVKTRRSDRRGDPAEAVDRRKQERLTRSALAYLKRRRLLNRRTRFDIVSIVWSDQDAEPRIAHLRGAFEAAGRRGMFS